MDRALVTSYPGCSLVEVFQRLSRYGKCINIPEPGVRLKSTRKVDVIYVVRVSEVYKPRVSRKSPVKHRLVVTGKNVSEVDGVDERKREVRLIFLGQEVVSELLSIPLKGGVLLGVLNARQFSACHSGREEVSLTVGPLAAVLWVFPAPKLDGEVTAEAEAVVDLTRSEDVGNPASPLDNTESDPHYVPGSQSSSSSAHLEESAAPAREDLAKAKSVQGNSIFSGVEDDWPESRMHHSTPANRKTKKGEESANERPAQTSSSTDKQAAVKNVKKFTKLFPSSAAMLSRHSANRKRNNRRVAESSPRRAEKTQEISGERHVERVTKPCTCTQRPHVENPVCHSLIPPSNGYQHHVPYGHQHHAPNGHQHHVPCGHQHHLPYPHYGHYNCSSHCCRPAQHPPAHFHPPPADCCNHSGSHGPTAKCGCSCSPTKTHTWCSSNIQHPMPVACSCCSHVTSYTPQMSCCNYQKSNCLPNNTHAAIVSKCCCNCSPEWRTGPCEHNAPSRDNPSPNNDVALTRTQDWVMHWEPIQSSRDHAGSIDTGSSSSDDAKSCSIHSMRRPEILLPQTLKRNPESYDLPGPSGVQFNRKPAAPKSTTSSRRTQVNDVQSSQVFLTQATAGSCTVDVSPPKKKRKLFNPAESIVLAEESSESVIGESQPFDTQPSAHPLSSSAQRNEKAQPEVASEEITPPSPTTSGVNHLKRSIDKSKTNPQTKDDCLRSNLESNRREGVNEEQDNSKAVAELRVIPHKESNQNLHYETEVIQKDNFSDDIFSKSGESLQKEDSDAVIQPDSQSSTTGVVQEDNVTSEPVVFSDYSSLQNPPNAERNQSRFQSPTEVIQEENDIIVSQPTEVLSDENCHQNQQNKKISLSETTSTEEISKKNSTLKEIPSSSAFREQKNISDDCSDELSDKSNETIDLEAVDEEISKNTKNKTKKKVDGMESGGTKEISKKDSPFKEIPSRSALREQKNISDECSDELSDKYNETIDVEAVDEEIHKNTENKKKTTKKIDEMEGGGTKEISKKDSPLKEIPSSSAFREPKNISDECSDEFSDKSNEIIDLEAVDEEIPKNTENKKKTKKNIDELESGGTKEISKKDSPLKEIPSSSAFREQKNISDECNDELSDQSNETIDLEAVDEEIKKNTENKKKTKKKIDEMESGGTKEIGKKDYPLKVIPSRSALREQKKTSDESSDEISEKSNETINMEAVIEEIPRNTEKKKSYKIRSGGIKKKSKQDSRLMEIPSRSPSRDQKKPSKDLCDQLSEKCNKTIDLEAAVEEIIRKEIKDRKKIDEIEKGGIKDIERKESPLDRVVNPSGSPCDITNKIKSISADSSDHTSAKSNETMNFEAVLKIQKITRSETLLFPDDEMELTQPMSTPQSFVDARSHLSQTSQESRRGTPEKWLMKHVNDLGGGAAEDVIKKLNALHVLTPLKQALDLRPNCPFRVTGVILEILPSLEDPFSIVFGRCNANCAGIFPYEELKEMEVGDQADCPHCRLRAHRLCPACHVLGYRHMLCLFFQLEIHLLVDKHVLRIELEHKRAADFLGCSPGTYLRCYPRLVKKLKAVTFNSPPPHKNLVVQLNATVRPIVKDGLIVLTFQHTELRKHLSLGGAPYKFINIK